ncbi:molybdate ABC transporter substrate-binding protein [Kineosporia mesophila]|uniref:Molybdate ABC transporter substrate-binding protein n=1 Tax=Kineosporia mesophila TaxID=566012 RepID=A0ABP6ZWD9_9ACTN|nr:molybdate ABC transporter substrate-binding protein [Kineosporia mesophila]MCD5348633.1 molybdate ABC transporter substrate-binding protein [Kineosporia mesophila]
MRRNTFSAVAVLAAATLSLAACGGSSSSGTPSASSSSGPSGEITVFAAASLTGSFTNLGKAFEAENPGTKVTFSFGPSSGLAEQIDQGAPADVFASAATKNMDQVVEAGNASNPVAFANNTMEIAVPADNPAGVDSLDDLTNKDVKVVLCAQDVPCGVSARAVFKNAGITVTPVSNEVDVKSTLSKITLGEADAGLVYVTDVKAAGDKVSGIEIPADDNATTTYPIASLKNSKNADLAQAFVDYVLSDKGTAELGTAGFSKP